MFEVIAGHPSIIVGTSSLALVPAIARGMGARVIADTGDVELLVSRWPGPEAETNLAETGRIAVTFTQPETYGSYQIKGRVLDLGEAGPEDHAFAQDFVTVLRRRIAALGEHADMVRVFFVPRGLYRVRFAPESVFDQTPGRNAGAKL